MTTCPKLAVGKARLIVESEEGLRWYVLGALAWLGFVAFILTGLFTTVKEARDEPKTHVVERVPKPGYGDTKKN